MNSKPLENLDRNKVLLQLIHRSIKREYANLVRFSVQNRIKSNMRGKVERLNLPLPDPLPIRVWFESLSKEIGRAIAVYTDIPSLTSEHVSSLRLIRADLADMIKNQEFLKKVEDADFTDRVPGEPSKAGKPSRGLVHILRMWIEKIDDLLKKAQS